MSSTLQEIAPQKVSDPGTGLKNNNSRAMAALIGCALLWSIGGLLIKMVSLHPMAIAGVRSLLAAGVFMVFLRKPKFTMSFAQIGCAVAYTGTVTLYVFANKLTTAANAILLQYTAPIFVAFLSWWILKERITKRDWISIAIVMGGMVLFFMDNLNTGNVLGNVLAILSGLCFALEVVFLRLQKSGSPFESILFGNILTFIIGIPFMFQKVPTVTDCVGLLLLGIFQLGIAYFLYGFASKHVSALEMLLIPVIEPILNPVWVFAATGEKPGTWALAGGLIVLSTLTIRCIPAAKRSNMV